MDWLGNIARVNLEVTAARLGVSVEEIERLHRLAGEQTAVPLPVKADVPAILDRLLVPADDAADIMAGWPDSGSPYWTPELRWLLDRSTAMVSADLGGHAWLSPGPELPGERGLAWRYLYVYGYLALVDVAMGYHRDRDIAEVVSWVTLADLGRNLAIARRMHHEGWSIIQSWLTLHSRGAIYELGRLQYQRGGNCLDLHIPETGPLTPQSVGMSLDQARTFFPRHFPGERYTEFSCGSWLLDPQLLEYLPGDSNIARFQSRFDLEPQTEQDAANADVEVLRFVFRTETTPIDQLPRRTVLQRAIIDHIMVGRHWHLRRGRIPI
jgi:hypothetical protein